MRCYRKMNLPGVDILADHHHFMTVKQASSVTKQNGRAGTVSELYGVTQWDCDFKTYKLQGDWQAALGITIRVPHLSWMSMEGEAKRDWPGSIFFQSPWYQEYSYIEDYFARLNTVLTRGNACTRIGVMHPVESAWLDMGPEDQTKGSIRELDQKINQIVSWLLFGMLDFDFVSEALLEEQNSGYIQRLDKELQVGDMRYSVILLPCMKTIRSSTLKALRSFAENGGEIIVIDKVPEYVDGRRSEEAAWLEREGHIVSWSEESVLCPLEQYRDVEVRKEDGSRSDNLFYQLREDRSCKWLFLCHVNRCQENLMTEESYCIRINGTYRVTEYDALSGKRIGMESVCEDGMTVLCWRCYAQDSLLLRLERDNGKESGESVPEKGISINEGADIRKQGESKIVLRKPNSYRCLEPNMLLLDYASYQVDDGEVHGREEILRLDNHIRRLLGFASRDGESEQPWFLDEKENHKVVLYYTFRSEIRTAVRLGMERPENCRIWLNGIAVEAEVMGYYVDPAVSVIGMPDLEEGENRLKIEVRYNQKTNLENLYLLGDFGVKLQENRPIVTERCRQLLIGDITGQGMPFYTGNLEYDFMFQIENEGEYIIQIPDFVCPALKVFVDGEAKGLIAFAPHCVCLGQLSAGRHRLTVRLFGNRHNGFGYLHNSNEKFVWYGPAAYRTVGAEWTDRFWCGQWESYRR